MLHEHVVPAERRTEDVVVRELTWSLPGHTSHRVTHAAKASRTGRPEGIKTSTRRRGKSACTPSETPADPRDPAAGKCRMARTKHVAAPKITTNAQAARAGLLLSGLSKGGLAHARGAAAEGKRREVF